MKRKVLSFIFASALCPCLFAQGASVQSMVINTIDGEKSTYEVEKVESITFDTLEASSPTTPVSTLIPIPRHVVFLGHSIWRNDNYIVRYADSGSFHTPFTGSFRGRGYQTLLQEVFAFQSVASPGPDGGYSGYSLGAQSSTDNRSIAIVATQPSNGWPSQTDAIWTIDFITNDFKRNIPIGTLSDYTKATGPTTFYGAPRQLYDQIKQRSGNDVIIVCANALCRNNSEYTSTSKNTAGHTLADYEVALLTVAARVGKNWYFVDQNRLSGITDQNLPAVTADGLHLNNLGYTMAVQPWISVFRYLSTILH